MGKSGEKTNTGEGDQGKRGRTPSDDVGGKSLSEKSKTVRRQCVGEKSSWCSEGQTTKDYYQAFFWVLIDLIVELFWLDYQALW
jgi:hypothetical protein